MMADNHNDDQCLLSTYFVPGTVINILYELFI